MRELECVAVAVAIASLCLASIPAYASPPSESEAPIEGPAAPPSETAPTTDAAPTDQIIEPPPPTLQQPSVVRVAVGLSSELDGNKTDRDLLDRLESSTKASTNPPADVRRLRVGSAEAREICREGRDDLVINIGYLPDRDDPVLLTRDCLIDEDLGIRSVEAAGDPALLGVLWAEHNDRVRDGARERKRLRISPRVRTGLIAGAVVAVVGVAVGLLIAGAVRRDSVVLVVEPR